jgi:hypothetical protein
MTLAWPESIWAVRPSLETAMERRSATPLFVGFEKNRASSSWEMRFRL